VTTATAPATDLTRLRAREIAARVQSRDVHPADVVRAHLQRIAGLDPQLGAFTAVRAEQALHEAELLGRRVDLERLPLAGVPVAVKENMGVAGLPSLHGSAATTRAAATADSLLVQRLRDAGCIVIGKTAMPELAIFPHTEGPGFVTRNPIDPSRTCGGSSGGSAVAVASGMSALAAGSDGGGSVRIPAACCGIVGVKTTPGLIPLPDGAGDHWYGLSVVGPLARDVQDAALMLDVMAGRNAYRRISRLPGRLDIAMSLRHPVTGASVAGEVKDAIRRVAYFLAAAGHDVNEDNPPYPRVPVSFLRCYLAGIAEEADALGIDVARAEPRTRAMVLRGRYVRKRGWDRPALSYAASRRLRRWMSGRNVLIAPVLAYSPPRVGRWANGGWFNTAMSVSRWMGFCPPWNLAGCPSVVVPIAHAHDGMPIAMQMVGSPASEPLLLAMAAHVEAFAKFAE
jgi:amidase